MHSKFGGLSCRILVCHNTVHKGIDKRECSHSEITLSATLHEQLKKKVVVRPNVRMPSHGMAGKKWQAKIDVDFLSTGTQAGKHKKIDVDHITMAGKNIDVDFFWAARHHTGKAVWAVTRYWG